MAWQVKYNKTMPLKVEQYLDYQDEDNQFSWLSRGRSIPSIKDLCLALGVSRKTIYNWCEDEEKAEFKEQIERLEYMQEILTLDGGLSGNMNSNIVKMVLYQHGYHDKASVDHTSSDGSMTPKGRSLSDFYDEIPEEVTKD